jgi:hypothetical protein
MGDSPPLALATHTRVAGGQGVSVRTATAKPFKSQGALNMNNDKAQELTARINESVTALRAETDAAKQSEIYLARLSIVNRFYKYSFGNWLLIWMQKAVTYCYTSLESMNIWVCASLETRYGRHVAVRTNLMDLVDRKQITHD